MNPARTFGPDLVGRRLDRLLGVRRRTDRRRGRWRSSCAFVLRGPGGGKAGSGAAQGALNTEVGVPDKN